MIILFVCSAILVNAQSTSTAVCSSKANLVKGVESGLIEMGFPETSIKEDIEKYAFYYKNAFTINFDQKLHVATIKMVENTSSNRRVILRFLAANQIQNVVVEGKSFLVNDFYENFLK
jgi:hypothetical protein